MVTAHSCFKVTATSPQIKGHVRGIKLIYYESTPKEDLPGNFLFYVTSEQNSYSALYNKYMNGKVILHFSYLGKNVRFGLKSEKFIYLKEKSGCIDKSFWELWEPFYFNHENFKNCSKKCSAITLPNNRWDYEVKSIHWLLFSISKLNTIAHQFAKLKILGFVRGMQSIQPIMPLSMIMKMTFQKLAQFYNTPEMSKATKIQHHLMRRNLCTVSHHR